MCAPVASLKVAYALRLTQGGGPMGAFGRQMDRFGDFCSFFCAKSV
jgi:hypothetical protein